ncbi:MAG: hypothetical protein HQM09_04020 [Candidatus Riflebacteria bacterium]|nr:hypothetical protein [Candidatus Riflebacteria bacterium]
MKKNDETMNNKSSKRVSFFDYLEKQSKSLDAAVCAEIKLVSRIPEKILDSISNLNPFGPSSASEEKGGRADESILESGARMADAAFIDSIKAILNVPKNVLDMAASLNPFGTREADKDKKTGGAEDVKVAGGEKKGENVVSRASKKVFDTLGRLNPFGAKKSRDADDEAAEKVDVAALHKKIANLEIEIEKEKKELAERQEAEKRLAEEKLTGQELPGKEPSAPVTLEGEGGETTSGDETQKVAYREPDGEVAQKAEQISELQKEVENLKQKVEIEEEKAVQEARALEEQEKQNQLKREAAAREENKQEEPVVDQGGAASQASTVSEGPKTPEGENDGSSEEEISVPGESGTTLEKIRFKNKSEKLIFFKAIEDLNDEHEEMKLQAAEKLGELGKPEAAPILVDALIKSQAGRRELLEVISESIIRLNVPGSSEKLASIMDTVSTSTKLVILNILSHSDGEMATTAILNAINDKNKNVQRRAITVAGWKNLQGGAPIVKVYFETERETIEQCCLETLSNIQSKVIIGEFITRLQSENLAEKLKADKALRFLTGKEFGMEKAIDFPEREKAVTDWLKWWEENMEKMFSQEK